MPLISDVVKQMLLEQVGQELYNSNFYMRIAGFLNTKGLKNIARHFEQQIEEEQTHSRIIYKLLTDLGEDVIPPYIEEPDITFSTIGDIANLYLQREVQTTNDLKAIMIEASQQGDGGCPIVSRVMSDMILLQENELEEATDFFDKSQNLQQWWQVQLWDVSLGDK